MSGGCIPYYIAPFAAWLSVFFCLFSFTTDAAAIDSVNFYLQNNNVERAKNLADKAIVKRKYDAYVWFQRGEVYMVLAKQKKQDALEYETHILEACQCFQKAASIQSKNKINTTYAERVKKCHNDISKLAAQHYQNGNYETTYELYNRVLDLSALQHQINKQIAFDSTILFLQALALEKSGNLEAAKRNYLKLLSIKYKNPPLYSNLAYIYKSQNQLPNAIKTLEVGLKIFPYDKYLITDWVNISIMAGRQRSIVNELRQKVQQNKNNADLHFVLANLYDNMNLTLDAEAYYKRTLEIDTGYIEAAYNLAVMYYNIGIEKNKQLNVLERNSANFKVIISERNVVFKKAEAYFKKATRLNPKEIEKILKGIRNAIG